MTLLGLHSWADLLLEAFAGVPPADASIVRLEEPPDATDEVELCLLRLDGAHPCDLLDELAVGEGCLALGVVCGGWAAPIDGCDGPPSGHPDAERILQVVLADRSGNVVSRLRFPDGTVLTEPPAVGAVLESLLAALEAS